MTPRVLSASHHLQAVREGEPLPALNQALKEVCREHFRRIDRFIQLALLGSARCVGGRMLETGCGVYLGSGFGPIACNVAVQEQMLRDHELPKPFDFVNTLGVSAGFYVAKNFGLTGQNLCISRRGASLEAVLTAALTDLALGAVSQALVGVVEEVTLPLTEHQAAARAVGGRFRGGRQPLAAAGSERHRREEHRPAALRRGRGPAGGTGFTATWRRSSASGAQPGCRRRRPLASALPGCRFRRPQGCLPRQRGSGVGDGVPGERERRRPVSGGRRHQTWFQPTSSRRVTCGRSSSSSAQPATMSARRSVVHGHPVLAHLGRVQGEAPPFVAHVRELRRSPRASAAAGARPLPAGRTRRGSGSRPRRSRSPLACAPCGR